MSDVDSQTHTSPWPEWYATQEDTASVTIISKASGEKMVIKPPTEWGRRWAWNISEDGTGVVIRRTEN